jgi:outer membrane protein OmpA-like peptidoglycan-associated protein
MLPTLRLAACGFSPKRYGFGGGARVGKTEGAMSGIFLRWGVPALVTVVGGTSLAISATDPGITADLTARAGAALTADQADWAAVSFDARDAVLTGTATDQQMIDDAIARVASVHGVRSVRSAVVLAEFVSPFPFSASIENGEVTLSGGVPDESSHAEIVAETASTSDSLRLLSGAPARAEWRAAVDYGLAHLREFDDGEFTLADLAISIRGRARSPQAFDALASMGNEPLPAGATLVKRDITPALASPFTLHAEFNGSSIAVSGYTPSEDFAETLRNAGVGGWPVSTSLVLASGAPEGFEQNATRLLENLVRLESGSADISDSALSLEGSPADSATADAVRLAMTPIGADLSLAPPRVDAYEFIATRTGDGIVLFGHVPDAATRDRLEDLEGVDAAGLELARGQPERFDSAVEFGLGLLGHLSEGRFTINGTRLSISGRASTVTDFTAAETTLALGAPQGLILAGAEIRPPMATPFTWSARKDADGGVRLAGFVPSRAVRNELQGLVAGLEEDTTTIADGNPENFGPEAAAALALLPQLKTASIEYDGTRWTMTGAAADAQSAFEVDQAFGAAGLREAGWSLDIELPRAAAPVALPIIDPYVWRAQKSANGTVTIGGFVPTEGLRRILLTRAGAGAVDTSNLGAGFPDGFITGTLAGIDALQMLNEGTLGFDGRTWSLTGQVAATPDRLAVEAALRANVDTANWRVAIQALNAAPVAAPYRWMATKAADGKVSLSGYVTTTELKSFVEVRAGDVALDTTEIASGEPAGFTADVLAGLEALGHLASGTVKYEDGAWTLAGTPRTAADATLALAALDAANSGGPGWQHQIGEPVVRPAPEPVEVAVADPAPAEETEPAPADVASPADPATAADPGEVQPAAEAAVDPAPAADPATAEPQPATAPTTAPDLEVATLPDAGVAVPEPEPEPEPAAVAAPEVRNFVFSATKPLGGPIALDGAVPADATRRFFGVIAGEVPTDGLSIGGTLPADFIPSADAGIRLLAGLDAGEFGLDGETWVLNGKVESEAQRTAALASIAAVPAAAGWQTEISLLPAIDVCRRDVAAFAGRNALLFESGSARLADESAPAVDELAGYLTACPDATVHIEGHTDADGDDQLNLALSVARAEAVVEALIQRGVGYQRLYAVGYGEGLPVADNDTAAGKRANRRIAFTILDPSE